MREIVDLGNNFIQTIDLAYHNPVEFLAKIGVAEAFRQELRKDLDRHQRIADFVRHARGQVGPKHRSIEQYLFFAQSFLRSQILNHSDGTRGEPLPASCRVSTESDRCVLLPIQCCGGIGVFDSSVSRSKPASLVPTLSTGLFKAAAPDRPRIFSAGGLNHRTIASSSMATMPGGIDFRSVSASVF